MLTVHAHQERLEGDSEQEGYVAIKDRSFWNSPLPRALPVF